MGEYAFHQGQEVKIGTCESLYYLRWDQRGQVTAIKGSLNPMSKEAHDHCLWRFPWPWEDDQLPGGFDSAWGRGMTVRGLKVAEAMEHGNCQLIGQNGYLLNLPCPEQGERWTNGMGMNVPLPLSATAQLVQGLPPEELACLNDDVRGAVKLLCQPATVRVALNGYGGSVRLVAQRWWQGKLVAVCECKGCGRLYRMPDESDASDLVVAIEYMAQAEERTADQNGTEGNRQIAVEYREIIRRIRAGYMTKEDTHDDR